MLWLRIKTAGPLFCLFQIMRNLVKLLLIAHAIILLPSPLSCMIILYMIFLYRLRMQFTKLLPVNLLFLPPVFVSGYVAPLPVSSMLMRCSTYAKQHF